MKKIIICSLCVIATALIYMSVSSSSTISTEDTTEEKQIYLSDYDYEVTFDSPDEIKKIAEDYDLENPDEIEKIIYVPLIEGLSEEKTDNLYD